MNRIILALAALLAVSPIAATAQAVPQASSSPGNAREYDDPGLSFIAPDNFVLVGFRKLPLAALTDNLQIVAGWALKSKDVPQTITLSEQLFDGNTQGYETRFESDLRSRIDGALVKSSERTTLLNGMPAYFVDISYGSGFTLRKEFAYIWADGVRGVALEMTARTGELDAKAAKAALLRASAVRYPADRE
ncbi:MAG: hypothetical protein M3R51_10475 [Candidatus Eremiobacteraeota bacterium]|nr:hypothetical protein [Candidatus Eremiobacteraeota bacterium]